MKWITDGSVPKMSFKNDCNSVEFSNPIVVSDGDNFYLAAYCNDVETNEPMYWVIMPDADWLDNNLVKMWCELPEIPKQHG